VISVKKPLVLFYPSVGRSYGIGNFLRCVTLARLLPASLGIGFLLPDCFVIGNLDWSQDFIRFSVDQDKNLPVSCEVLVFDHQGPVNARAILRHFRTLWPEVSIIALDYFHFDEENLDVFVNLIDYKVTEQPPSSESSYYIGLKYAIIRPEFFQYREFSKNREDVKKVLITIGGEDISEWTLKAMHWLEIHVSQKVEVTVVLGDKNAKGRNVRQFAKRQGQHRYLVFDHIKEIEEYMCECDVAFCGGGTTIMELAYLGIPAIALPQHEMERKFIDVFQRNNFVIGNPEESVRKMTPEPCARLFEEVTLRRKVGRIGKELVDGKGALRVAKIILRTARA